MKRRSFIKKTTFTSIPLLLKGIPVFASSDLLSQSLEKMALAALNCDRILVIIQQNGGNDGLNTVFPMDKWSNLVNARSNILMDQKQVLPLSGNLTTGLHPAMTEMQNLYDNGKMMIVQGVSYPNPIYSHFKATDIWFSGSGSNTDLDTGWLGRALDIKYPNFPNGYPTPDMSDPLAIQIGSTLPFSLQGPHINMGYSAPNPNTLLNVINGVTDPAPDSDYGHELTFLRLMKDQSNEYIKVIQKAYNVPAVSPVVYPSNNKLADQLKIVAKLINGGLKSPIYIVNHPNSHDTHSAQVNTTDKTQGTQATNLTLLSQAIGAFQQDLEAMGKSESVSGMTFSEFGRRIKSNASLGTDHGAAAPVLFFGSMLNTSSQVKKSIYPVSGMIGKSPNLPTNATVSNQIEMQFDYRQLYTTVMQDWLCMTETEATQVLGKNFVKLPIFNTTILSSADFDNDSILLFPNPSKDNCVYLRFPDIVNDFVSITLLSINGQLIKSEVFKLNQKELKLDYTGFVQDNIYIISIDWNGNQFYKKVIFN
jgi:uncharacterized protein (DUF1501 family)